MLAICPGYRCLFPNVSILMDQSERQQQHRWILIGSSIDQGVILPSEGMEEDELYYVDFDGDCLDYVLRFFDSARSESFWECM